MLSVSRKAKCEAGARPDSCYPALSGMRVKALLYIGMMTALKACFRSSVD
jgi:hypothetical protein